MPKNTPSCFTIYNASAGAGKTHTLVQSYLYRLLNSPHPNQVQRLLAITFTNKAAQEMKNRILHQLDLFSKDFQAATQNEMFLQIASRCGISNQELHLRSLKSYEYILHHFGQFNVFTIDRLTHQIIRTFARDFGINTRFEVVLDSDAFMDEVVTRVLNKAGHEEELTKTLVDYVLQKADALKSWDVTHEVSNIAQMFVNENHMQPLSKLVGIPMDAFGALDKKVASQQGTISSFFKLKAETILEFLDTAGVDYAMFPNSNLPKILLALKKEEGLNTPLNKTIQKALSKKVFLKAADKKHEILLDPVRDDIAALLGEYNRLWPKFMLLALLRKNIVPLSLMQHIGKEVNALQKERNTRLLGFFNKHIADNIKDTSTPFIYERLGVKYQHFFVDEFQDTSILQWQNLNPLFSHALEDDQRQGSLVLVGDAKQSIYRWRGGNPEQFMRLVNKETPFSVDPVVENLPKNYRSGATIVSFNNTFFTKVAQFLPQKAQQKLYSDTCCQEANAKEGGYVTVRAIEGGNKEEECKAYQAAVIALVEDCLSQKYSRKDICVLVRKNEQGVQIAKALTEAGHPITSSESLRIQQSPEVQFLMHLVKLRLEPKSAMSQYSVLERFALEQPDPFTWTQKQQQKPFKEVLAQLTDQKFDFSVFQNLTVYAALEYAVWAFSLTQKLTAHLQAFLDEIAKLEAKKEATTTQVLAQWNQHKSKWAVRPPEDRDAIKIMTLHKAKGLAFPVVILPFSDGAWMDGNKKYAWYSLPQKEYSPFKEMLLPVSKSLTELGEGAKETYNSQYASAVMDTLNTLYVGMTRPINELHVLTKKAKPNNNPKDLATIFSYVFPDLQDKEVSVGKRKIPSRKNALKKVITPDWQLNINHILSSTVNSSVKSEEAKYGILFHQIMADIIVPQDIDYAISKSKAKEILSQKKFEVLVKQVCGIVQHQDLCEYFNPANAVYCERALLSASGEIIRPDRFVVTANNEGLILDYKTGAFKKSHADQIAEYANVLQESSINIKQKILVYTEKALVLKEV